MGQYRDDVFWSLGRAKLGADGLVVQDLGEGGKKPQVLTASTVDEAFQGLENGLKQRGLL